MRVTMIMKDRINLIGRQYKRKVYIGVASAKIRDRNSKAYIIMTRRRKLRRAMNNGAPIVRKGQIMNLRLVTGTPRRRAKIVTITLRPLQGITEPGTRPINATAAR